MIAQVLFDFGADWTRSVRQLLEYLYFFPTQTLLTYYFTFHIFGAYFLSLHFWNWVEYDAIFKSPHLTLRPSLGYDAENSNETFIIFSTPTNVKCWKWLVCEIWRSLFFIMGHALNRSKNFLVSHFLNTFENFANTRIES